MKILPNPVAQDALDLVERTRAQLPPATADRVGVERLDAKDWQVIRQAFKYDVQRRSQVDDGWCALPGKQPGTSVLRLQAGLPTGADRLAEAMYLAFLVASDRLQWSKAAHTTFAWAVLLPRRARVQRGPGWVRQLRLEAAPFGAASLGDSAPLLRAARALGRHLCPVLDLRRPASRLVAEAIQLRDAAAYDAAETLFQLALRSASDLGDWETASAAMVGLGRSAWQRGNYPQAGEWFGGAVSVASLHECAEQLGRAHHYLLVLAAKRNDEAAVLTHFRSAYTAYGPDHPRVPVLHNDLAAFWIDTGKPQHALALLRQVAGSVGSDPEVALAVHSNMAMAAAKVGSQIAFEVATCSALALLPTCADGQCAAAALLELADASLTMRDLERARSLVARGLEVAQCKRLGESVIRAEALLRRINEAAMHSGRCATAEPLPSVDSVAALLSSLRSGNG